MSFLNKIPRISLYVMAGVTILIALLYFVGGSDKVDINNNSYDQPVYTNLLLIWTYILVGLSVGLTLVFVIAKFVLNTIENPKSAIKPLCILVGGFLLFVIAYSLGDGTPLKLIGYEGTSNVYSWLKVTDMFLYVIYTLSFSVFGVIIYTGVSKYFK